MTSSAIFITALLAVIVVLFDSTEGCYSQQDCGSNECCVSNDQPRGKRMSLVLAGHCQAMGQPGSRCLMRYGGGKTTPPLDMVYACPCGPGLMCKGSGLIEVPLGETGVCTHH
ncbi:U3-aranetoxin-Ce1a-like [Mizuhopecten yessoensis]|uniref:U3-aranetoxin-Ce1a-like n=1 Tax=Mizuhopecten yessoensis TaxID=6573 RepID=UPI000B45D63D|nr:U3-aranetoxin-Ce1a-like [Mizuhopecten yessoensis]